jgi:8-oxo-dGTP diphosphatase
MNFVKLSGIRAWKELHMQTGIEADLRNAVLEALEALTCSGEAVVRAAGMITAALEKAQEDSHVVKHDLEMDEGEPVPVPPPAIEMEAMRAILYDKAVVRMARQLQAALAAGRDDRSATATRYTLRVLDDISHAASAMPLAELMDRYPTDENKNMKHYVVGYLFSGDLQRVVLIRKTHPEWQAGKLNGVGGQIEPNESPLRAMQRKFLAEAGTRLTGWTQFATLTDDNYFTAHFYWSLEIDLTDRQITSPTDEVAGWFQVSDVLTLKEACVANLLWLIPMAINDIRGADTCMLFHITEKKKHTGIRHDG